MSNKNRDKEKMNKIVDAFFEAMMYGESIYSPKFSDDSIRISCVGEDLRSDTKRFKLIEDTYSKLASSKKVLK